VNRYRILDSNNAVVAWINGDDPYVAELIVSECNKAEKRRNQEYEDWLYTKSTVYQR